MAITTLSAGTSRTGLPVSSGSELDVLSGGLSTSTAIAGVEMLLGGVDSSGVIDPGGVQNVASGGEALGDFVNAGGVQTIASGGLASGNTIIGSETVMAGGVISGNTVQNGPNVFGIATIAVNGSATGTTVSSGGSLLIGAGGLTTSATIFANGQETVSPGGSGTLESVASGGTLNVLAGGQVTSAAIGGVETVYGIDSRGYVSGTQTVEAGGTAIRGTVTSGGILIAEAGAVLSATSLSGSMTISDGQAIGIIVAAGGSMTLNGGQAAGTTVSSGGRVTILSGGSTTGTTVLAAGREFISGGLTTGSVIASGGSQTIAGGGALDDIVSGGGIVVDNAVLGFAEGDTATSTFNGVLSGSGGVVQYGQGTLVLAGTQSSFTGTITISGGTVALASTTGASGIEFASGGFGLTLQIDGDAPGGTISGFDTGDAIDLAGLRYPAGGLQVSISGNTVTLTSNGVPVHFAGHSLASLTIAGASNLNVVAFDDGNSGTEIAALGDVGAPVDGGVSYQITGYQNGAWGIAEATGIVFNFSDGGNNNYVYNTYAARLVPYPVSQIIQSGPGTLNLSGVYESNPNFYGNVVIDGGTVETVMPAGDGVQSFSFASGATGTLVISSVAEYGAASSLGVIYLAGYLNPITAIAPGDVIDFTFLPYSSSGLSDIVTASSVAFTSNGTPITIPNKYPILLSSTSAAISIANANQYTYGLRPRGQSASVGFPRRGKV